MITKLYIIKDELSEYAPPIAIETEAQAKRYFREMVEKTTIMKNNPEDFSIWENGEYNTENGMIVAKVPKLIERAQVRKHE